MAHRNNEFTKTPVREALSILEDVKRTGATKILVGFSGGKDSFCTLDVCIRAFGIENVVAFQFYYIKDLEVEMQPIRNAKKKYPQLQIIRLLHPNALNVIRRNTGRTKGSKNLSHLKGNTYNWKKAEAILRSRTGIQWIAYGQRMQDSLQRRGMLHKCQGLWHYSDKGSPIFKVFPIYRWRHTDTYTYLRNRKLPIPYTGRGDLHKTSGLSLRSPRSLMNLKKNYPEDYKKLKFLFPHIERVIYRDQVRAAHGIRTRHNLDFQDAD